MLIPALLWSTVASAASVAVQVRGLDGQPLPGAVVMLDSAARKPGGAIRFPWPYVMAQQNITFQPHVLIVPVGTSVTFPNRDKVRHHVYSFSKPKKFELKLYGREEARAVMFDKPGVVSIGCNIHDMMSAFVIVVETPFAAQSGGDGRIAFADVPTGAATLTVWHPSIRAPGNMIVQPVSVSGTGLSRVIMLGAP